MAEDSKQQLPTPAGKQPSIRQRVEAHLQYSGPLPMPSHLQDYEKIVPGAADRIIRMAEKQAEHRQFLEKTVVISDARRANKGLYIGGFVAVCFLGGAVFLIFKGHDAAGATLASLDIIGLVSVFIYGTISRRGEREKKTSAMTPAAAPEDTQSES